MIGIRVWNRIHIPRMKRHLVESEIQVNGTVPRPVEVHLYSIKAGAHLRTGISLVHDEPDVRPKPRRVDREISPVGTNGGESAQRYDDVVVIFVSRSGCDI